MLRSKFLLRCVLVAVFSSESMAWKQPKIALSFWVDPVVPPSEFSDRYAEIAAANFTAVLGGFGALTPEVYRQFPANTRRFVVDAVLRL